MNFFEQQDRAKRNTARLVTLLCLAVISLIAMSSVAVVLILAGFDVLSSDADYNVASSWMSRALELFDWELVLAISVLVVTVVVLGSLFKHFQLRSGGKAVAESLNGRLINPGTTDLDERKILNVVEEMAIASGIAVPPVYVIEDDAINAFAAGHSPQDAVIGITRGCLHLLNRSELQGVIAHEFSHVFHGDMKLNIRLVATLHGILLIGLVGYLLLRSAPFRRGGSDNKAGAAMAAIACIGLALVVIGFAGTFFGNLIKAAVSRQREFLADASAVQFTRDPDGIAGALKKIGGYQPGSQVQAANATEYSHMFFSQAVSTSFSAMMATHPPLPERIRRIQPQWDGQFAVVQEGALAEPTPPPVNARARLNAVTMAAASVMAAEHAAKDSNEGSVSVAAAHTTIDAIGQPGSQHVQYAQRMLETLDPVLKDAAHDSYSARAVVYGLLLSQSPDIQAQQLAALQKHAQPEVYSALQALLPRYANLEPRLRLPLLELSLPALKQLSPAQYATFKTCLDLLIQADKRISLMEWALHRIIVHNLEAPPTGHSSGKLADYRDECESLLSAVIQAGHPNTGPAQAAFQTATANLPFQGLQLQPPMVASAQTLEFAVNRLSQLQPSEKRPLLQALAQAVEHDGVLTTTEAELLRAIADALDCPLPPLLENAP